MRRETVSEILIAHWAEFGRNYYSRHDYEALDSGLAGEIIGDLRSRLGGLTGTTTAGLLVTGAEEFSYTDPVDGSHSTGQGLIISYEDGARAMLRLSGTGTEGATIRIYLERYVRPDGDHSLDAQIALKDVICATEEITGIRARTGRTGPDVIS